MWQISVKRVRGAGARGADGPGEGGGAYAPEGEVSTHLHAHVREGSRPHLSAAYGDLVLDDRATGPARPGALAGGAGAAPLLLASAGIGVTPMIAMLRHLAAVGHRAPVTVVHADHSPADHAPRADHLACAGELPDAAVH